MQPTPIKVLMPARVTTLEAATDSKKDKDKKKKKDKDKNGKKKNPFIKE